MHCQPHHFLHPPPRHPVVAVAERPGDPNARVGDADREVAADLLADAAAAGYLRLDELDERLAAVWSATTRADLSAVERDLPVELHRAAARDDAAARARANTRAGLMPYAAVMLLLLAGWFVVGVIGGGWYPWPIWPALGWGLCLLRGTGAAADGRTP